MRSLRWDIEHGDPAVLHPGGYDLIVLRHILAALQDRTRVLRLLAGRLRPGGALAVITAVPGHTPRERHTALDEEELALASEGWQSVERLGELVRDRIPQIIQEAGAEPVTYTAGPAEYPRLLLAKLYEELGELAHADISAKPEELADLTEALDAYARELGITKGDLEALRADKRRKRGGFSDGVVWLGNR